MKIPMDEDLLALRSSKSIESRKRSIEQLRLKRALGEFPGCWQMLRPANGLIVKRCEGFVCTDPKPGQQFCEYIEGFVGVHSGERVTRLTTFHQQCMMRWIVVKKLNGALTVPAS